MDGHEDRPVLGALVAELAAPLARRVVQYPPVQPWSRLPPGRKLLGPAPKAVACQEEMTHIR